MEHKTLANGRWYTFSLCEQMAHIGSEVERAILWKHKGNTDYSKKAFFRALELIDLTVADPKNKTRLREILRVREALADYFFGNNIYRSTDQLWRSYFFPFAYRTRLLRDLKS